MAPCRPGDVDGLVQTLCDSPPTSTEEALRRVSLWAEDVVRRSVAEEEVRWWDEVPPPEEEPPPEEDRGEADDQNLPIYCVTRGPASRRADLGIWTGTWNQLRNRLGFTKLFGSGFHVKRCADITAARAYWFAEGRKALPEERRLDAAQASSSS